MAGDDMRRLFVAISGELDLPLLHWAVLIGQFAAVSVLLAAGRDEEAPR